MKYIKHISFIISCSIVLLSFSSCKKNEIDVLDYEIQVLSDDNFESVYFVNDTVGYISGGNTYNNSKLYQTINGGKTWDSIPTNTGKTLYNITSNQNNKIFVAGFDSKIVFNLNNNWQTHQVHTKPVWLPLKQIAFSKNYALACGGLFFNTGFLLKSTDNFATYQQTDFEVELYDLAFINDSTIMAVGYGSIIKSTNYGETWANVNVEGDVYVDITIINNKIVYVIGEQGSILKSEDSGENWQYLRKANTLVQKQYRFTAIYFIDELNGFITGDKGTLWQTNNGGKSWQVKTIDKKHHYTSLQVVNERLFLVGKNGVVVLLNLP